MYFLSENKQQKSMQRRTIESQHRLPCRSRKLFVIVFLLDQDSVLRDFCQFFSSINDLRVLQGFYVAMHLGKLIMYTARARRRRGAAPEIT
jgi:hypothetical protein